MGHPQREQLEFAERIARLFEEAGAGRIRGRLVGWLLICDPPEQSQPALVELLGASKASVSTELRTLMHTGVVERTTRPGERRSYYRIRESAWTTIVARRLRLMAEMRAAADQGLELLAEAPPARRRRLERVSKVYGVLVQATARGLDELDAEEL